MCTQQCKTLENSGLTIHTSEARMVESRVGHHKQKSFRLSLIDKEHIALKFQNNVIFQL